jgi:hypothetical protein
MKFISFSFIVVVLLSACTSPGSLKPGTSEAVAIQSLGQARASYVLADGTKRLEYSGRFSQQTWMLDFQPGGLVRTEQVMTMQKFSELKPGQDNKTTVQHQLGIPYEISQLPRLQREVWSYRLKLDGVFPALMHVQFDPAGRVREIFSGPDFDWEREIPD